MYSYQLPLYLTQCMSAIVHFHGFVLMNRINLVPWQLKNTSRSILSWRRSLMMKFEMITGATSCWVNFRMDYPSSSLVRNKRKRSTFLFRFLGLFVKCQLQWISSLGHPNVALHWSQKMFDQNSMNEANRDLFFAIWLGFLDVQWLNY